MITPPDIANSTIEERRAFIKAKFPCIADCDMCGLCKVFRGQDAEHAYGDYIINAGESDARRIFLYDKRFSSGKGLSPISLMIHTRSL